MPKMLAVFVCSIVTMCSARPVAAAPGQSAIDTTRVVAEAAGESRSDANADAKASAAASEQPSAAVVHREWFGRDGAWRTWGKATGDWASFRQQIEAAGVTPGFTHTVDISEFPSGSLGPSVVNRGLFDMNVKVNLGKVAHVTGGTIFAQYYRKGGGNGSDAAGDAQGFSNIDADNFGRTGEFWYEQSFGERIRFKVGRVDANTEFAYVDNGKEFINSSMGYSPTIFALPTYPTPIISVNAFVHPVSHVYFGAGIYNGDDPETGRMFHWSRRFLISEAGATWALRGGALAGRLGVGVWHHDGEFTRFDDESAIKGTLGTYVVFDQTLWAKGENEEGAPRQVVAFFQYGQADERISEVSQHIGAGMVWTGAVPSRDEDLLGTAVTIVRFSGLCVSPLEVRREVSVGAFYKFGITGWLSLKPDIQIIQSPRTNPNVTRLVVATMRLGIDY